MPLSDDIKQENKKFKFMTPKEKARYIWDYYKFPIIIVIVATLIITSITRDVIRNSRETYLHACMINSNYYYDTESTLLNEYKNYSGVDTDAMQLVLDFSMHIHLEEDDPTSAAYQQKIMALFSANDLDVMVGDEGFMQPYAESEAFLNIEEVLPADLKEELEQKGFTYYTATTEDGNTVSAGIRLDHCQRFEEDGSLGTYTEDVRPIFAITHNTQRIDHAIEYLRFLISKNE